MRTRRVSILAGAVLLVVALTACAGAAGAEPKPTSTPSLQEQLEVLPGVTEIIGEEFSLTVVVAPDATTEQVLTTAEEAHALASETSWPGRLTLARVGPGVDAELDATLPDPWSLALFPGEIASTLATLGDVLTIEQIGGVSLALSSSWPVVLIASIESFAGVFDSASATDLFAGGGTYSLVDDHLQVVHVPARTSAEAIHEVIAIASDYPNAEVLLQATTAGPQWPELYIARVSAEEASAIDARLRSPALTDADPDGLPLGFQLTVIGPDGPIYTHGNFGDVPDGN
jgi:hypothetical protein